MGVMTLRNVLIALGGLALLLILMRAFGGQSAYVILLYIGIGFGLLATLAALSIGLGAFTAGNQDKAANAQLQSRMMRLRIIAQGTAVLCGTLLLLARG